MMKIAQFKNIFDNHRVSLNNTSFLLFAIILVAISLRLIFINWSLPNQYHTATYNCDESTCLTKLQGINPSKLDFNPVSEKFDLALSEGTFHFYIYALTLKLISFTKWLTLTTSKEYYFNNIQEWSKFYLVGRLLSVFFGVFTVIITYVLAKRIYNLRVALLSALFVAIMPSHVIHSRYIIMNVPGLFWIILSFLFFKNILDYGRVKDYLLAGVSIGFAISTRYSAAPLSLMLIFIYILSDKSMRNMRKIFFCAIAIVLAFIIGEPYAILDHNNFIRGVTAVSGVVAGQKFNLIKNIVAVSNSFIDGLGLFLFIVTLLGIILAMINKKKEDIMFLIWIFINVVFFVRAGASATSGRILPALPFVVMLGARFIDFGWTKIPLIGRSFTFIIVVSGLLFYFAYFQLLSQIDIRDLSSKWIMANIPQNSTIGLICEPSAFSPGIIDRKYRYPEHKHLLDYNFICLDKDGWVGSIGYDRLQEFRPDYLVLIDHEIEMLGGNGIVSKIKLNYGYREVKRFEKMFSVLNFRLRNKIPPMLYIPNSILILQRK